MTDVFQELAFLDHKPARIRFVLFWVGVYKHKKRKRRTILFHHFFQKIMFIEEFGNYAVNKEMISQKWKKLCAISIFFNHFFNFQL